MFKPTISKSIIFVLMMFFCSILFAQETSQADGEPLIEGRAEKVLSQMCDYLKNTEQFTFRAEVEIEDVLDSGQKLLFERTLETFIRRPNKVRVNFQGEIGSRRFWYDGSQITLLENAENLYASAEAPATIDEALDFAMETYGVNVPIADLLFSDPYQSFVMNVESGTYVGTDKVRSIECHHLAFTQESIDWQIWIEDGEVLVPRKIVIIYKQMFTQPQYRAVFTDWNLSPRLSDILFEFTPPAGADEIKFLTAK